MGCRRFAIAGLVLILTGTRFTRSAAGDGFQVLVLAPGTPVVLQIEAAFDGGASISENRRRYSGRWFSRLDHDQSGWIEAGEAQFVPSFGRFEELPGEMRDEWTRLDLAPADGRLSRNELFEHINSAMGSGLSVERPRRPATQTVVLHPRLDRDRDGQVSLEEISFGLRSLNPFDFDDDESLSAAELQPFPRSMRASAGERDLGDGPFLVLDDTSDRASIARRLLAHYGKDAQVECDTLGLNREFFDRLDVDDSGGLDERELLRFLDNVKPNLHIALEIPSRRLKRLRAETLARPGLVDISDESSRRLLIVRIGGLNVVAELQDARGSFEQITQRFRTTQFGIADRDRNGELSPTEFARLEIEDMTFAAVDADRDGVVSQEEFLEFVGLRALLAQCRLQMVVEQETTSLFEALDADEDYRLSPREFRGGVEPLRNLDRNGNGKLAESELVTRYSLSFAVTRPPEFDDLVGSAGFNRMEDQTPLPIMRPVTQGPEWFRKMDRNQDGDVTWREFLGPRDAFDRLDADKDGLIDSSEASI